MSVKTPRQYRTGDKALDRYYRKAEANSIRIERPSLYAKKVHGPDRAFLQFIDPITQPDHDRASRERIKRDAADE